MAHHAEERFAALLAPIRDLAATWNVDVAHELEEYLEELESISFSFEGGPSLNFAEAALLVQGSTCIYSKKVEYLHSLVYQALEYLSERRKRGGKGTEEQGSAAAEGFADELDEEEQFLSLDDTLEEGTGIDLDESGAQQLPPPARPPAALLALEDDDKLGLGDTDCSYRLASCMVHRSGALLLESRDGDLLDEHLQPVGSHAGVAGVGRMDWAAAPGCGGDQGGPSALPDGISWEEDEGGGGPSDDDGPGGFGGDDAGSWEAAGALDAGGIAQNAAAPRSGQRQPRWQEDQAALYDPYKPLDPNSKGSLAAKPYKKMSRVAWRPPLRPQLRLLAGEPGSLLALQPPAGGLLLPEFAYAVKTMVAKEGSRHARQKEASSRKTSRRSAQTHVADAFAYDEVVAGGQLEDDDDADDLAMNDYFGAIGSDDEGCGPVPAELTVPELHAGPLQTGAPAWLDDTGSNGEPNFADGMSYEELCRAHIEAFISAATAAQVQTDLALRVSGWRTKIQPVLEEEDARPEFDMHAYGERLLERMAALSCAADVRAGSGAVADTEAPALSYAQVVAGEQQCYNVSRCFSSTLQLINNGNVRITKLGGSNEHFHLTLLDAVLPHKRPGGLQNMAPAACTAAAVPHDLSRCDMAENRGDNHEAAQGRIRAPKPATEAGGKPAKRLRG